MFIKQMIQPTTLCKYISDDVINYDNMHSKLHWKSSMECKTPCDLYRPVLEANVHVGFRQKQGNHTVHFYTVGEEA